MPYVTKVEIDSKQLYSAKKVVRSAGKEKLIRSDHYPLIVLLEKLPLAKVSEPKESSWNVLKPGGWDIYKLALEEESDNINNIIEDKSISEEEVMKKIDTITDKVKFKAFGKSKPITLRTEKQRLAIRLIAAQGLDGEQSVKDLMRKQYDSLEIEINKLKEGKFGRITNILKMKEIVSGSKKIPQEVSAVYDIEKKELVVSNDNIKKISLKHCMNTLKNRKPDKDVEELVELVNKVHEKRMIEKDDEEMEIKEKDFDELMKRLTRKNKRSYDFLIRSGSGFKNNVFKLCQRLIKAEKLPTRFFETVLHQLWKKEVSTRKPSQPSFYSYERMASKMLRSSVSNKNEAKYFGSRKQVSDRRITKPQSGGTSHSS